MLDSKSETVTTKEETQKKICLQCGSDVELGYSNPINNPENKATSKKLSRMSRLSRQFHLFLYNKIIFLVITSTNTPDIIDTPDILSFNAIITGCCFK